MSAPCQRNPESLVWERPGAPPVDYSDGAESRILDLVRNARDLSVFSPELAALVSDWPTEYHFSRSRHALLRPLAIQPGARVLELGCGCGALTRFLGEAGASVVAVEGNPLRAQIAAARCRALPNVAVHLDPLAHFPSPPSFDWVLLVGVLEYAPAFSSSPDPVAETLARAARFLSPNGRLAVAIENKLGLKYFNARPEDHLGIPFYGIQNLYAPKQPLTFGKAELVRLLARAGFLHSLFFYPFPDYKLPETILADSALSLPSFNPCDVLPLSSSRDYASPSAPPAFSEPLVWRELHANGLLPHLANSFLAVASINPLPPPHPAAPLAWSFFLPRDLQWALQTTYSSTPSGILADRQHLAPPPHPDSFQIGPRTFKIQTGPAPFSPSPLPVDFLRARARPNSAPPPAETLPLSEIDLGQALQLASLFPA